MLDTRTPVPGVTAGSGRAPAPLSPVSHRLWADDRKQLAWRAFDLSLCRGNPWHQKCTSTGLLLKPPAFPPVKTWVKQ